MNKRFNVLLCASLVSMLAVAQRADNYPPTNDKNVKLTETNLPIAFINVKGNTILHDSRITARLKIIDNGEGKVNYGDTIAHPKQKADYDGYISLKYRGNSSFYNSDKKPYGFKTIEAPLEEGGKKKKVKLLGMAKDNDWALLAPFSDKSMIRDVLTFELGRPYFGYTPHSRFCEVVLDGTYYGVFILTERPGKGKGRLNLNDPGEDEGDLTGDYHVEIDRDDENVYYTSPYRPTGSNGTTFNTRKITYQYDDPDGDDIVELPSSVREAVDKAINDMETSFTKDNYTDPEEGYRKYINPLSFIDYLLSTEFSFNIDGYRLSTHLYKYSETRAEKEGLDARWQATLWDFNIAYGNANYHHGSATNLWQYDFNARETDDYLVPFWWSKLLSDPAFVRDLKARWKEYRLGAYSDAHIEETIDKLTQELTSGGAIDRNEQAWKMFGRYVWPNAFVGNSYAEEIDYLKMWIRKRVAFLDSQLLPKEVDFVTAPVSLTADSYNADVIVEALPASSHINQAVDSWRTFYAQPVREKGGLPADGKISSAANVNYQLADYAANNALSLTVGEQSKMTFDKPVSTGSLFMLATCTEKASTLGVKIDYEDGTTSDEQTIDVRDWSVSNPQGDEAYVDLGYVVTETDVLSDRFRYCLFESSIAADADKKAKGITVRCISGGHPYILALSRGLSQVETGISYVSAPLWREPLGYYTLDGIKVEKPVKGINIIRYTDGTSQKIVVR